MLLAVSINPLGLYAIAVNVRMAKYMAILGYIGIFLHVSGALLRLPSLAMQKIYEIPSLSVVCFIFMEREKFTV